MREQLKQLLRHSVVYGLGRFLEKGTSFLLIPFYTRYLSPNEYGISEILLLTSNLASMLFALGIGGALARFHSTARDAREQAEYCGTGLVYVASVGCIGAGLAITFADRLSSFLLGTPEHAVLVRLVAISFGLGLCADFAFYFLRIRQRSALFVAGGQVLLVTSTSLSIYLVAVQHRGLYGVFMATAVAMGLVTVVLVTYMVREVGVHFSLPKLRQMLPFGVPMMLSLIAAFLLNSSDRFFLQRFGTLTDVGLYAVAYKFGYIVSLALIQPFYLTWSVQCYQVAKQEDGPSVFSRVFTYVVAGTITVAFLLSLFIGDIFHVAVDPRFASAAYFVPLIAFAYVVQGLQPFFETGLLVRGKTGLLSLIAVTSTAACLVFNVLLIYFFGIWGACLATLLAFVVSSSATFYYCQCEYPFHCDFRQAAKVLAAALALLAFVHALHPANFVGRLALQVSAVAVFFLVLFATEVVSRRDVATLLEIPGDIWRNRRAAKERSAAVR